MNIKNIALNYILNEDTSGALMINGNWGIGKSYYWKHHIVPKLENIKNPKTKNFYKCLYVSLNGVKSPQQVFDQLVSEKFPISKLKIAKLTSSASSLLYHAASKIPGISNLLDSSIGEKTSKVNIKQFLSFKDNILCFDDFERNKIQEELLGWINTHFIEQDGIKIIIIGNETEIPAGANYKRIKEKVIFRIAQFPPNLVGMDDLLNRYSKETGYFDFLKNNEECFKNYSSINKIHNLRTLLFCLDIVKAIYETGVLKGSLSELSKSVIFFTLLIGNEFKEGRLLAEDYLNNRNLNLLSAEGFKMMHVTTLMARNNREKRGDTNEIPPYELDFFEKYKLIDNQQYYFFESIYRFILTGDLDESTLKNEVAAHAQFVTDRDKTEELQNKVFRTFRELYWLDSDKEILEITEKFLQYLQQGDYLFWEYGVYYHILKDAIDNKIIVEPSGGAKALVIEGLKNAIAKNKEPYDEMLLDNVQTVRRMSANDGDIDWLVGDKIEQLKNEKTKKQNKDYLDALSTNHHHFLNNWIHVEPFDRLSVEELMYFLENAPASAYRNLKYVWDEMAKTGSLKNYKEKHKHNYEQLQLRLNSIVAALPPTGMKRLHLEGLKEVIEKIVQLLV